MQKLDSAVLTLVGNQIERRFMAPFKVNGKFVDELEDLHKALNELKVLCFQQSDEQPAYMIPRSSILDIVITCK